MALIEIFKKQGGINLLKQYWMSHSFFTAIVEFLLLGKGKKSLEILRLSTELKTQKFLKKKYEQLILDYKLNYGDSNLHKTSNIIWFCWLQGMEQAPYIVKTCYYSIKKNFPEKKLIFITNDNYKEYITFPSKIQKKIDAGIIQKAHLSDLIRLELLIQYGGTWSDATVFYSSNNIPEYMFNSNLFVFQCMKPGYDGHSTAISNWFISAKTNNKILILTRDLLYKYWYEYDEVIDYYIFHHFFQIAIEIFPEEWQKVIPFSNSLPHILLLRLFEQYNEDVWMAVKKMVPIHKLTYKFENKETTKKGTYFDVLFGSTNEKYINRF